MLKTWGRVSNKGRRAKPRLGSSHFDKSKGTLDWSQSIQKQPAIRLLEMDRGAVLGRRETGGRQRKVKQGA